jgi:hypothetical protein
MVELVTDDGLIGIGEPRQPVLSRRTCTTLLNGALRGVQPGAQTAGVAVFSADHDEDPAAEAALVSTRPGRWTACLPVRRSRPTRNFGRWPR